MEGQYFIVICDDKEEAIDKAIDALKNYRRGVTQYSESRGGGMNYRNHSSMSHREREIYEMGMREGWTPEERRIFEMGKRDAYGRNGAENFSGEGDRRNF